MAGTPGCSGGPRPGSGPKPRGVKHASTIADAETRIVGMFPSLLTAMHDLAKGMWVAEDTDDGEQRVYQKPADRQAAQYLLDRIMGKPLPPIDTRLQDEVDAFMEAVLAEFDFIDKDARHRIQERISALRTDFGLAGPHDSAPAGSGKA